jgi:TolA-binding protein
LDEIGGYFMEYKEQLMELYIEVNRELMRVRSGRVYNMEKYKAQLSSLNLQIKEIKEQLESIKEQEELNARPRVV